VAIIICFLFLCSTDNHAANVKEDNVPVYEEMDTIKDERYSIAVGSTKPRNTSALASNHSSYIEMHPGITMNDVINNNLKMYSNSTHPTLL